MELYLIGASAGPADVRIRVRPPGGGATIAPLQVQVTNVAQRYLSGVEPEQLTIENLSSIDVEWGPTPLVYGQGVKVPARSQWSVSGVSSVGGVDPRFSALANPKSISFYYHVLLAQHVPTTRWLYTVPAGRRAYLESALVREEIVTAPPEANALILTWIGVYPGGGSGNPFVQAEMYTSRTVGTVSGDVRGASSELMTTDQVAGITQNDHTGGTVDHLIGAKLTELDQ